MPRRAPTMERVQRALVGKAVVSQEVYQVTKSKALLSAIPQGKIDSHHLSMAPAVPATTLEVAQEKRKIKLLGPLRLVSTLGRDSDKDPQRSETSLVTSRTSR